MTTDGIFIDLIWGVLRNKFIHGINDFHPAGVIKSQSEGQALIVFRNNYGLLNRILKIVWQFLQPTDVFQPCFIILCPRSSFIYPGLE
jgi:hypothetical protein